MLFLVPQGGPKGRPRTPTMSQKVQQIGPKDPTEHPARSNLVESCAKTGARNCISVMSYWVWSQTESTCPHVLPRCSQMCPDAAQISFWGLGPKAPQGGPKGLPRALKVSSKVTKWSPTAIPNQQKSIERIRELVLKAVWLDLLRLFYKWYPEIEVFRRFGTQKLVGERCHHASKENKQK